ncbi:MAG: tripartite tricarboxylate transporter substrate-binding protein [Burkholderiaceae bacterium]|nr:tripartite tricarboxylate transporter substrate binding protein [Rhodoferax sp.]MCB2043804.1 tripartite tricarboxylate transporter substrate binding protein [Rhodoferax sp.]MCW5630728.1 tripartite tricarboxylate transporter substrate binding protein [Rhodoferax sp.]
MKILPSVILATTVLACAVGAAQAQAPAWPATTVRIIVPYPPGTEPDVLARDLGNELGKQTGKTFLVENKPGANSILGTDIVAKADGDGGTMLMVDRLAIVTNPQLYKQMPYRWEESLRPVSDLAGVNLFLSVREDFPARTYAEFIQYAKANPGKINVGTGGNGHVNHIAAAMIAQAQGVQFTYVPYKGVAPAVAGLLSREIDATLSGGLVVQGHARTGKLRVLAVGDNKRASFLPDVPTIVEAGGVEGSIPSTVFALIAPARTPDALVNHISQSVAKAISDPALLAKYNGRGLNVAPTRPADTLALMKKDAAQYEKVIREAGIKVE